MAITNQAKKFLVIDDDRTLLLIVRQVLTKSFPPAVLTVYDAASGEDGLKKIGEMSPDIILSDIRLPGIDGFEVCQKMRQANPHSAVILMSAYDAEEDNAAKASLAGADAYLSKPIKKGELLFVVNFVLRVAHLNSALSEKNRQLEKSLERLKVFHQKLGVLNEELRSDKRRLDANLGEMRELNAQLEGKNTQISVMMEEVAGRFDSTVILLSNIIELNQAQLKGHSERVAGISLFVAEKMGLSEIQRQNIKVAARLHELGIVSLPLKDRTHMSLEIRGDKHSDHPLVGEMLLKGFPDFEQVAEIIRHLHENIDGSGTPDGLYGDRIPIGSRIISAASYFDHAVMTGTRKNPNEVLEEMENKGIVIFDDHVITILKDYIRSKEQSGEQKFYESSVFGLTVGMELVSDLYSESGINLLRSGTVLDVETLARVLKFNKVDPVVGPVKIRQK
ncbi:MAG: hypothetical protein A3K09_06630 [Nitrospinae bacterium RIFCSPLOWO2_12_FULL_47_7]|nr:MAG: hypothetical protein A3K09_06630 [Nitrospinae bacterium RIFCSPLOWO2_12_FULL_47_7]